MASVRFKTICLTQLYVIKCTQKRLCPELLGAFQRLFHISISNTSLLSMKCLLRNLSSPYGLLSEKDQGTGKLWSFPYKWINKGLGFFSFTVF